VTEASVTRCNTTFIRTPPFTVNQPLAKKTRPSN